MADPQSHHYPRTITALLSSAPRNDLVPGEPAFAMRDALAALAPETITAPRGMASRGHALACCAALWLRFDYLDEAHKICQELAIAEGSYWHAIVHRREGDDENAKYWLRRVGQHPVFAALLSAAQPAISQVGPQAHAALLFQSSNWDAARFVDLCQVARREGEPLQTLCEKIQQSEWELLFDYCFDQAVGDST